MDAVTYFGGPLADLMWRRGWTHGVLAVLVLPFFLTSALILLHRLRSRRTTLKPGLDPKQLLLLSFIAVLSHPILDTLNTYGVRWLMPFSGRWFYGDALFIVDPWVWTMLAVGVFWSWHRQRTGTDHPSRPAQVALAAFAIYAGSMWITGLTARTAISRQVEIRTGHPVVDAMAGPLPVTLFTRSYVAQQEKVYRVGALELPRLDAEVGNMLVYPRGRPAHPAYAVAESTTAMRRFLGWARFPTFRVDHVREGEYLVHVIDLRYAREPGHRFGSLTIPVTVEQRK